MKNLIVLIFLLVITFQATAQVKFLEKGKVAPYSGYLFTPKQEMKIRKQNEENKLLKQKSLAMENLQVIQTEKSDYYKSKASKAESAATKARIAGDLKGVAGFILGVIITGAISYAALKAVEK